MLSEAISRPNWIVNDIINGTVASAGLAASKFFGSRSLLSAGKYNEENEVLETDGACNSLMEELNGLNMQLLQRVVDFYFQTHTLM